MGISYTINDTIETSGITWYTIPIPQTGGIWSGDEGWNLSPFTPMPLTAPTPDPLADLAKKAMELAELKKDTEDRIIETAKTLTNEQLESILFRLDVLLGSKKKE